MPELITNGRRLVTIRKINAIDSIEGADLIVKATVDGWDVVVKKNEFNVGDYCVFFEIDSFVPVQTSQFAFLAGSACKIDEKNVERFRLRTKKMKGVVSQGLALPVTMFEAELEAIDNANGNHPDSYTSSAREKLLQELEESREGIEQFLHVTKYERPDERENNSGSRAKTAADFPFWVPKTDSQRLQNLYGKYSTKYENVEFRPSLKMDGSSTTISFVSDEKYFIEKLDDVIREYDQEEQILIEKERIPYPFKDDNGCVIVCSRNLVLKYDSNVNFWKAVHNTQIHEKLKSYCIKYDRQLSVQAEMTGPGVNGNWDKFEDFDLHVFHIWDIEKQEYLDDLEFQDICSEIGLKTVKQFEVIKPFKNYNSIQDFLKASEIPSVNNKIAEGIVYVSTKKIDGLRLQFKVINNLYLLSEK